MAKRRLQQTSASRITLVDPEGNPRMLLWTDSVDHHPQLTVFDAKGLGRIAISLGKNGNPLICVLREDGSTAVGIGETEDGEFGISINHGSGKPAFSLFATKSGETKIDAFNADGSRIRTPLDG